MMTSFRDCNKMFIRECVIHLIINNALMLWKFWCFLRKIILYEMFLMVFKNILFFLLKSRQTIWSCKNVYLTEKLFPLNWSYIYTFFTTRNKLVFGQLVMALYIQFFFGYCFIILRQFSTFIMLILRIMIIFKFEVTFIFLRLKLIHRKINLLGI